MPCNSNSVNTEPSMNTDYRATEGCRSVVFFQTIWTTICWKIIMVFLHNDTKGKLPTPTSVTRDPSPKPIKDALMLGNLYSAKAH